MRTLLALMVVFDAGLMIWDLSREKWLAAALAGFGAAFCTWSLWFTTRPRRF